VKSGETKMSFGFLKIFVQNYIFGFMRDERGLSPDSLFEEQKLFFTKLLHARRAQV
jgi:hypothetical protein